MRSHGLWTIRVKQSLPVQPLIHVQVSGAEHSIFVAHEELQIAKLMYHNIYNNNNNNNSNIL